MLGAAWLAGQRRESFGIVWRVLPDGAITALGGLIPGRSDFLLREFAPAAAVVLVCLLAFGLAGGWFLAGRMLVPLTRVTEALLLLGRTDRRAFPREPVDLSLTAEEATETLLPLADKHAVTLDTAAEAARTVGSPALLLQMTTNLVHNAIVHNEPDGVVLVRTATDAGCVALSVENTGEPLDAELVPTLAEPFQRGSGRVRRDQAGVGLGLAIVRSIARAHDGTLTLEPRDGGGLRVTVRLPAAP